ncbi:uncharacterized protein [Diadema setosum]|uniref:uncharacterized protein n=1 Tax=Diadema setosum TaxID=31175 RepID=UPI003B3B23DC
MDKSALLFDNEMALKVSRVRSCTAIVVAALLVGGAVAVTLIIHSDHRATTMCPTSDLGHTGNRIMDTDVAKDLELRDETGKSTSETLTYNSALNTVLLNSPGNFSVGPAATIAIDFDRSVVVLSVHEDRTCMVFALQEELAEMTKTLVRNDQRHLTVTSRIQTGQLSVASARAVVLSGWRLRPNQRMTWKKEDATKFV